MAVNPQTYPENADYNVALASISKAAAVRECFQCVTYTDSWETSKEIKKRMKNSVGMQHSIKACSV